jgi:hypothetical protein
MRLPFALAAFSLALAGAANADPPCIENNLPGHEHFCLRQWDKNVTNSQECRVGIVFPPVDHLKIHCISGSNAGKDWEIWCRNNGAECNISIDHLCTYSVSRMRNAHEWNVGQHCTNG